MIRLISRPRAAVLLGLALLPTQQVREQTLGPAEFELREPLRYVNMIAERSGDEVVVTTSAEPPKLVNLRTGTVTPLSLPRVAPQTGDQRFPEVYTLHGDSVLLLGRSNPATAILLPDGRMERVPTIAAVWSAGQIDAAGRVYYGGPNARTTRVRNDMAAARADTTRDSVAILRTDRTGGKVDTLAFMRPRLGGSVEFGPTVGKLILAYSGFDVPYANPLHPADIVAVGVDGRVGIVRAPEYRVDWVLPDGRIVRGAPIPFTPVPVTAADRRMREYQNLPPADFPPVKPPARSAAISSSGDLWVELERRAGDSTQVFDIIDSTGARKGRVRLPDRTRFMGFGNGTVYLVRTAPEAQEYLQRYRLPVIARP